MFEKCRWLMTRDDKIEVELNAHSLYIEEGWIYRLLTTYLTCKVGTANA